MASRLLEGKISLITGGTRGIGWETARAFASNGSTVVLSGRGSQKRLDDAAAQIKEEFGTECMGVVADVTDLAQIAACYQAIFKQFKRLDVLINNAGVLDDAFLGMIKEDVMIKSFDVNVWGTIRHIQTASRLMARNRSGTIINLSSIVGLRGNEGEVVYASTKAAIIGVTLSAAKELAPKNIRVNAVAPGFIDTEMTRHLPEKIYVQRVQSIRMGRVGTAEDVANVLMFLASDLSSYVTGQVIGVDGGMLI